MDKCHYGVDKGIWTILDIKYKSGVDIPDGSIIMLDLFNSKYNANKLIVSVDLAKSNGNEYFKLGFKAADRYLNEPSYVWTHSYKNITFKRYQTMKHKLVTKGWGTEDQTEDEIMSQHGFLKVYDCGSVKLEWIKQ